MGDFFMFNLITLLPFINKNTLQNFFFNRGIHLNHNEVNELHSYISKNAYSINKSTLINHIYNKNLLISNEKKDQIYHLLIKML